MMMRELRMQMKMMRVRDQIMKMHSTELYVM